MVREKLNQVKIYCRFFLFLISWLFQFPCDRPHLNSRILTGLCWRNQRTNQSKAGHVFNAANVCERHKIQNGRIPLPVVAIEQILRMEDFKTSGLKITWADKKDNRGNARRDFGNINLQSISRKLN